MPRFSAHSTGLPSRETSRDASQRRISRLVPPVNTTATSRAHQAAHSWQFIGDGDRNDVHETGYVCSLCGSAIYPLIYCKEKLSPLDTISKRPSVDPGGSDGHAPDRRQGASTTGTIDALHRVSRVRSAPMENGTIPRRSLRHPHSPTFHRTGPSSGRDARRAPAPTGWSVCDSTGERQSIG